MSYSFLGCKVDCNAHDADAALVVRHPNSLSCKTSSLRYCINSFKPPFVVRSLPQLRSAKCATPSSPQCLPRTSISPELRKNDAVAPCKLLTNQYSEKNNICVHFPCLPEQLPKIGMLWMVKSSSIQNLSQSPNKMPRYIHYLAPQRFKVAKVSRHHSYDLSQLSPNQWAQEASVRKCWHHCIISSHETSESIAVDK